MIEAANCNANSKTAVIGKANSLYVALETKPIIETVPTHFIYQMRTLNHHHHIIMLQILFPFSYRARSFSLFIRVYRIFPFPKFFTVHRCALELGWSVGFSCVYVCVWIVFACVLRHVCMCMAERESESRKNLSISFNLFHFVFSGQ